jgi:hypothetical protein
MEDSLQHSTKATTVVLEVALAEKSLAMSCIAQVSGQGYTMDALVVCQYP